MQGKLGVLCSFSYSFSVLVLLGIIYTPEYGVYILCVSYEHDNLRFVLCFRIVSINYFNTPSLEEGGPGGKKNALLNTSPHCWLDGLEALA